ncbi:hypothetical protein TRFO_30805 [Tritrichomonas foetus]|uniref:Uncharacterized protein n=1 Tax=Tritrichomonas foetus TaxID=1144522 RepID=A0A1J4JTW4_9EUKA|nr:hypothetical protein TRFO_30805 [Tritrichomonas foetus]|eukprot:OHT02186.1 hypothetical protein TRFO_30805 [Tritrichomonas foetus]
MEDSAFFESLPEDLRDELTLKAEINLILQEISTDNFDDKFNSLIQLADLENEKFVISISRSIHQHIFILPQSIILLSHIVEVLVPLLKTEELRFAFTDSLIRQCLFSITNFNNSACSFFLGLLIKIGIAPPSFSREVVKYIETISNETIAGLYFLFACCGTLYEKDPNLLNELFDYFKGTITSFQTIKKVFLKELLAIEKENFEVNKYLCYDQYYKNLVNAIHRDDVDFIQSFIVISDNDINMEYPKTLWEPSIELQHARNITLVDAAAFYGSSKCFKYMMLNGADIENSGNYAIDGGNLEIIRIIEQKKPFTVSSLFRAIERDRYEAFVWLYETKNFITSDDDVILDDRNRTLLHAAAMSNSIRICIYLLDRSLNCINMTNKFGYTPISRAVQNGSIDIVKILLGIPQIDLTILDKDENTLIHIAATNDDVEMLKLFLNLIDYNKPNRLNQTPLFLAAQQKAARTIKFLLTLENIDLLHRDVEHETPFLAAVRSSNVKCAQLLFDTGAYNINDTGNSLQTALAIAASTGCIEMMKYILSIDNVNINFKDGNSMTPIFRAIDVGSVECVQLFIQQPNIELNICNKSRATPLIYAINLLGSVNPSKHLEIVKLLIKTPGIDLNCQDIHGRTPICIATAYKSLEIVKLLLETPGVDLSIKTNKVSIL